MKEMVRWWDGERGKRKEMKRDELWLGENEK